MISTTVQSPVQPPVQPPVHHDHRARWVQDPPGLPLPRPAHAQGSDARETVYGSFTCPWSYLASQRTDLWPRAARPSWRMLDTEAAPGAHLAAAGRRLDAGSAAATAADLERVRALLLPGEHLPAQSPSFVPHTGPAVVGYAEAVVAGVADQVRRLLFDAYWEQGLDIGVPEVLRRLLEAPLRAGTSQVRAVHDHGYAVTLTGGPLTGEAHRLLTTWHRAAPSSGSGGLPALTGHSVTPRGAAALYALASGPPPQALRS